MRPVLAVGAITSLSVIGLKLPEAGDRSAPPALCIARFFMACEPCAWRRQCDDTATLMRVFLADRLTLPSGRKKGAPNNSGVLSESKQMSLPLLAPSCLPIPGSTRVPCVVASGTTSPVIMHSPAGQQLVRPSQSPARLWHAMAYGSSILIAMRSRG